MWKSTRKVPFPKKYPSTTRKCPNIRLQSSNPLQESKKSGGVAKTMVAVMGTTALGTGCVIGYAKYDPEFRKTLEENVPFSKDILSSLPEWNDIMPFPEKSKAIIKPTERVSPLSEHKAIEEERLLMKRFEKETRKKEEKANLIESQRPGKAGLTGSPISVPPPPAPILNIPEEGTVKDVKPTEASRKLSEAKKSSEEALKKRLLKEETQNLEINDRLETNLKESLSKVENILANASTAHSAAVQAIKQHTRKLYNALDATEAENAEEAWKDASSAMAEKLHHQEVANKKLAEMKDATRRLKATIKEGMESKITAENPILNIAEERINKMLNQLSDMEKEVEGVRKESHFAEQYKTMVEKGKEQFRKELEAMLPEIEEKGALSEEDLHLLIAHAHQRVSQLQKQLAKQQVTEHERIKHALMHQKKEDEKIESIRIQEEVLKQKGELEAEFEKTTSKLKDDFEAEMRRQLRRQAVAHSEHLSDVLDVQEKKFEKMKEIALEEKVVEERSNFQKIIGTSLAKLNGIEQGLKAREELDRAAKVAQELWLACQSMKESIRSGQPELRPLCAEVEAIRRCVDPSDSFVITVLNSIPQQALTRGIYTEEALKQRFTKVDKICRRVALVDDNHRSLYHYFLSFVQSFLILDSGAISREEIANETKVDHTKWDTFDILKRVRHSIVREDLLQAIRYANQLTGEPKNVANNWIQETLLLLETRQAIEALIAHAAAISVQAYH